MITRGLRFSRKSSTAAALAEFEEYNRRRRRPNPAHITVCQAAARCILADRSVGPENAPPGGVRKGKPVCYRGGAARQVILSLVADGAATATCNCAASTNSWRSRTAALESYAKSVDYFEKQCQIRTGQPDGPWNRQSRSTKTPRSPFPQIETQIAQTENGDLNFLGSNPDPSRAARRSHEFKSCPSSRRGCPQSFCWSAVPIYTRRNRNLSPPTRRSGPRKRSTIRPSHSRVFSARRARNSQPFCRSEPDHGVMAGSIHGPDLYRRSNKRTGETGGRQVNLPALWAYIQTIQNAFADVENTLAHIKAGRTGKGRSRGG